MVGAAFFCFCFVLLVSLSDHRSSQVHLVLVNVGVKIDRAGQFKYESMFSLENILARDVLHLL